MSHIGGLKKDMIILEKSEFSALRSENEVKKCFVSKGLTWVLIWVNTNLIISRRGRMHPQQGDTKLGGVADPKTVDVPPSRWKLGK